MRRVGIKVLKNRLSEYVRAAEAGETVLVTDRDRVVAEIVPHRPEKPQFATDEELIAYGAREGWLTPATRRGPIPAPTYPSVMTFEEMMKGLDEDREDRW